MLHQVILGIWVCITSNTAVIDRDTMKALLYPSTQLRNSGVHDCEVFKVIKCKYSVQASCVIIELYLYYTTVLH